MGWGQRALEFVPNPIKDLIVRGVNLVAGAGTEAIKDNRGEGTGKNANAQEGFVSEKGNKEREGGKDQARGAVAGRMGGGGSAFNRQ